MNVILIDYLCDRILDKSTAFKTLPYKCYYDEDYNFVKKTSLIKNKPDYYKFSLGLEAIKSYALENSKVQNIEIIQDYLSFNLNFTPDIIGVSIICETGLTYKFLKLYLDNLRRNFPKAIIVAGGAATLSNKEIIIDLFDAICLGEGEIPFTELINSTNKLEYLNNAPYWYTQNKCKYEVFTLKNLDIIPPISVGSLNYYKQRYPIDGFVQPLTLTRGCFNRCSFCVEAQYRNYKFIQPSIEKTCSNLEYYLEQGIDHFHFYDALALYDKKFWVKLLKFIWDKNIKIVIATNRFDDMHEEVIELLSEVCFKKKLQMSLETINLNSHRLGKNITLEKVNKAIELGHKYGFSLKCYLLFGFPWDTKEDILNLNNYIKQFDFDSYDFVRLTIFKGSKLYQMAIRDGLIPENFSELYVAESVYLKKLLKEYPDLESKLPELIQAN